MKRQKIKVLEFYYPDWFSEKILKELEEFQTEIKPIFNRNGKYWNKDLKLIWVEFKGRAFKYIYEKEVSHFKYRLDVVYGTCLKESVFQSLKTLIKEKILNHEMRTLYYNEKERQQIRNSSRSARKTVMRIKREKISKSS